MYCDREVYIERGINTQRKEKEGKVASASLNINRKFVCILTF